MKCDCGVLAVNLYTGECQLCIEKRRAATGAAPPGRASIHINPVYPGFCGDHTGIVGGNPKDVDCPVCKSNIDNHRARRELVEAHAKTMLEVLTLPKNANKGHWSEYGYFELRDLMRRELEEFHAAVWGFLCHGGTIEDVASEAADCSNFLAMMVDNLRRNTGGSTNHG